MNNTCFVAAAVLSCSWLTAQSAVLQVSPNGPFTSIQAAVTAAADGDLIEVTAGIYSEFTISGKRVSVVGVADQGIGPSSFLVVPSGSGPAIEVNGLAASDRVTIAGARIDHASTTAPAISIVGNGSGDVRLIDVAVTADTNLGFVPYDGVVEVRGVASCWLDRVEAGDARTFGEGPSGDGLAGLLCETTAMTMNRCNFEGLRPALMNQDGGDGMRILGATNVWMVDTVLMGSLSSTGAGQGTFGGHALHDFTGISPLIDACDSSLLVRVSTVAPFAVAGVASFLTPCSASSIGRTDLEPFTTRIANGTSHTVSVRANVGNRGYVTMLGYGFSPIISPVWDFYYMAGSETISLGTIPQGAPVTFPLSLPVFPAGVGLQMSLQTVLLDPAGSNGNWSMSTPVGFVVR